MATTKSTSKRGTSATATLAAGIRAHHWQWNNAPILADDCAVDMVSFFWRLIVKNRPLNWLVVHKLLGAFHPIHTEIILRPRYAEDHLLAAIAEGIGQHAILGAGLDTFSLRHKALADRVRIFELDHPATQAMKRVRVRRAHGDIPPNLVFVPIDFETDLLNKALARAGFDPQQPAFFSWLGTTYYLTKDAIRETLACVADVAAPGSRLVFDYKLPKHLIPERGLPLADKLDRFVARLGEPMVSEFTPEELNDEMARIGFVEMETLPADAQQHRYLQNRLDVVAPAPNFAFALFGTPTSGGRIEEMTT